MTENGNVMVARFAASAIVDFEAMRTSCDNLFGFMSKQQCDKLFLSFRGVQYIGSQALGPLVSLDKKLRGAGRQIVLCHLEPQILSVFELTRLDTWFTISDQGADAWQDRATVSLLTPESEGTEQLIVAFVAPKERC